MSIEQTDTGQNERGERLETAIAASYTFDKRLMDRRALTDLMGPSEDTRRAENLESALAYYRYLQDNVREAQIFQNLTELRESFAAEMPYSVICTDCMDGRTLGQKNIGLPTDFATVIRSAGNNGTFGITDIMARTKMNEQVFRSRSFTPPKPILWRAMGHYSATPDKEGKLHSCAAHGPHFKRCEIKHVASPKMKI
jgi:hypothetical protein